MSSKDKTCYSKATEGCVLSKKFLAKPQQYEHQQMDSKAYMEGPKTQGDQHNIKGKRTKLGFIVLGFNN